MHTQPKLKQSAFLEDDRPKALLGLDNCGEVFTLNGRVYRGVFPGCGKQALEVHERCMKAGIFDDGVVKTAICHEERVKHLGYELVFEHDRIPFISYAHEWSPQMLKDAALFQLDLNLRLIAEGLVLKDCGSHANVLFHKAKPVHVDFLSIIPIEALVSQRWLEPVGLTDVPREMGLLHEVFQRIFFPGMLYPLYLMAQGRVRHAQKRIFETFLNASRESIGPDEALSGANAKLKAHFRYFFGCRMNALRKGDRVGFHRILRLEIDHLEVEMNRSGYSDYYELKGEKFSHTPSGEWKAKQWAVYNALKRFSPSTVLDTGANTGWFSVLAAKGGADVIAADIDPACVDILYRQLREDRLSVQPMVVDLLESCPDVPVCDSLKNDAHFKHSKLSGDTALLLGAHQRLRCDFVIALAVIHHFCLGKGIHISKAVQLLAGYSKEVLLLEFVDLGDPLIAGEPEFFSAHHTSPDRFGWYNIEMLQSELQKHFRDIQAVPLTDTRTLLVCSLRLSGGKAGDPPEAIEHISWNGQHIASIIRADYNPKQTVFISPDSYYQQLGFVVYPKNGVVPRHAHFPLQRHLVGTPETLLIRNGRAELELYSFDKSLIGTWVVEKGDIVQLVAGGHCFKCLEDTVFLEIKQGPYTGLVEKESF